MTIKNEPPHHDSARERLKRLFKFLGEFYRLRAETPVHIDSYSWMLDLESLPTHSHIELLPEENAAANHLNSDESKKIILRVQRPKETDCPKPPSEVQDWLKPGWKDPAKEAQVLESTLIEKEGVSKVYFFKDDSQRLKAFEEWNRTRETWKQTEIPIRKALGIFSDLYDLWGRLKRDSEKFQLFLGTGTLRLSSPDREILHPLLLQRVELNFKPDLPEFCVSESPEPPTIYTSLLRGLGISGDSINEVKQRLDQEGLDLTNPLQVTPFARYLVQRLWSNGQFKETPELLPTEEPKIFLYRTLLLAPRTQGYEEAAEQMIARIEQESGLPESLSRIVGIELKGDVVSEEQSSDTQLVSSEDDSFDEDILLTKPANAEQVRIVRHLNKYGSVLVQGPPGTGKSHTIANLIGQLLAENKTVLVTSHTAKALRVVREKLTEDIKPLCVSVLDNDEESRRQLDESIRKITGYLSSNTEDQLVRNIETLSSQRTELRIQLNEAQNDLQNAQLDEYKAIPCADSTLAPSEAARRVRTLAEEGHDWLPGEVKVSAKLPCSSDTIALLYQANSILTLEDETHLISELPSTKELPTPEEFKSISDEITSISKTNPNATERFWTSSQSIDANIDSLWDLINKAVIELEAIERWQWKIIESSLLGENAQSVWHDLIATSKHTAQHWHISQLLIAEHGPTSESHLYGDQYETAAEQLISHLDAGKGLGFSVFFRTDWKVLIKGSKVDSGEPKYSAHFRAIHASLKLKRLRETLKKKWNRIAVPIGASNIKEDDHTPEVSVSFHLEQADRLLLWKNKIWEPLFEKLRLCGFSWEGFRAEFGGKIDTTSDLERSLFLLKEFLPSIVATRRDWLRLQDLARKQNSWLDSLKNFERKNSENSITRGLLVGIMSLHAETYEKEWQKLRNLELKRPHFEVRLKTLQILDAFAPEWCRKIEARVPPHHTGNVPGDIELAWEHKQLRQELDRRNSNDLDLLQRRFSNLKQEMQRTTSELVSSKAWHSQKRRLSHLGLQQALHGWLDIQRKIGAGTGKRVPILRAEAKNILKECKSAVPVWIMPVTRVLENFDFFTAKFDVVIMDEASQSDISALLVLGIANQAVVVGDHEQVSPSGIGQNLEEVQGLIDEFLVGIPNKNLYDGKTSVYDLARQSFGSLIRLVEHFRCVPEIIGFSNNICYEGEIKPLRESSSAKIFPPTIAHRIVSNGYKGKINEDEAIEVASLVAAITEDSRYDGLSLGVVSLIGEEQAIKIQSYIDQYISAKVITDRRILCGTSAQFQGDERDVMLLSVVSAPEDGGPLRLMKTDDFRKRVNVAASRARDQLWVVHSLDPDRDLKPDDLRLQLIRYAQDPKAMHEKLEAASKKVDSEFERQVLERLLRRGFHITPQWQVGAYRIDLVVSCPGGKVAIECDGDRFHPPEKFREDMERQMVLERLGWRFIRIRGTQYFRNPEPTMDRVYRRLEEMRITPHIETALNKPSESEIVREIYTAAKLIQERWKKIGLEL